MVSFKPRRDSRIECVVHDIEERVARLWEEVLRRAPLGADDDFFDLGGESLQAFALIGRVHDAFGVRLTARDLFAAGTIAGMASMLRERKAYG